MKPSVAFNVAFAVVAVRGGFTFRVNRDQCIQLVVMDALRGQCGGFGFQAGQRFQHGHSLICAQFTDNRAVTWTHLHKTRRGKLHDGFAGGCAGHLKSFREHFFVDQVARAQFPAADFLFDQFSDGIAGTCHKILLLALMYTYMIHTYSR